MLRTRTVWTGVAGTPYYSTFYWAGNSSALAEAAQEAQIDWTTEMAAFANPALQLQVESEVAEISETSGQIINLYDVGGSTSVGSTLGEPLPFQTQALVFFGTTGIAAGRRVRGRSFFPGLSEGTNTSGAGPLEVLREQIQFQYQESFSGAAATHVVWSRTAGQTYAVTSYQVSPKWSTLRTRRA